jgi:GAF domain-containing protein
VRGQTFVHLPLRRSRVVATHNASPELRAFVEQNPIAPGRGSATARAALERRTVQVLDAQGDPEYTYGSRQADPFRTIITVPILKGNELFGAIGIYRHEVRAFTESQISLLETFADQAVIAIENVRLFEAEQRRTRELSESLEQQTATSEVLKVISSSPGELEPVFNAMLENAVRICGAKFGNLFIREGDAFRISATYGAPSAYVEFLIKERLFRPDPKYGLGQLVKTKELYHLADITTVATYGDKLREATIHLAGARTLIALPMLKNNEVIGAIVIYRQEVQPFTDKQIELVKAFAAQAVIAIENTRLLNELRQRTTDLTESLEQQTATSKVLEVISRSAFDLQAVFETVAESSVRLCGADRAFIYRFDGELLRMAVALNAPQALKDFLTQNPIRPGRHSSAARAALERRTIHIPDVLADPEYSYGAKDVEKIRTVVAVPILKGDDLLGVMIIYHLEGVRPFTDKQIALAVC